MINIDDFVREKLGEQPEKADPAAWLKMKALLDKEMPERVVPFYFRLGKPVAFLGAALLLSILCVGGYELTKGIRAKKDASEFAVNTKESASSHSSSSKSSTSSSALEPNDQVEAETVNATHPDEEKAITDNNKSTNLKKEVKSDHLTSVNSINSNKSSVAPSQKLAANNSHAKDAANATGVAKKETLAVTSKGKTSVKALLNSATPVNTSGTNVTSDESMPKEETIVTNNNSVVNNSKTLSSNSTDVRNSLDESENKNKLSAKRKLGSKKSSNNISEEPNSSIQQQAAGNTTSKSTVLQKVAAKDSLPFTSVVQKETVSKSFPRTATTSVDTQGVGKIALQNNSLPSSVAQNEEKLAQTAQKKGTGSKAKNDNEFAAANKDNSSKAKDSSTASSNNGQASKSKKAKNKSLWDNLNLPEVAADAKRDLGNAKFYAGFSGGLNYSLSSTNNFQGVQFGPTGELVFNKHWSLFGAIKYFNRSGGTKTVNDNYAKENSANSPDSTSGANWFFKVHTDSTNRYFNFSTLHSFEMPITLRYALNKFYLMTGLNLAYYLSVNVEEVQKTYSLNSHMVQTNSAKPILNETKPLLNTNDFGSKFGLGFVLGAGYQITPAWQADVRLVNTFWDNSKGDGANKLSKDFYKLPSVQISVGYQFNRGRVKPTFGPTNTQ